ncbi:Hsp70 family protein [Amycolatopsis regifaucium]|uniref:Molecular chaperone Hsp70 n=1 Tax=Amycolatopsis regifaucium TaxID=546365 RepID=A0A154MFQ3_9PSEU|nr:Hsp70 family protein [Amycolatopsis regifaucium]KZB83358.1 molecular chaperone Hsp70 [Amycolatopsis regifaucium]OKA08824.1 molecular chaperone Hsp70 [Amycolatopsis regifaucium]SFI93262.1 Hsp70 protein [Amycolatopsis regifaucium]
MDVLAIDFGTSSTVGVLSIHGRGTQVVEIDGSVTMSSAIYVDKDGTVFVGRDAERRARLDPSRFEANPKRRIDEGALQLGDVTLPIADAFAAVLRRVGEEAELLLQRLPAQVRISHPAGWGPDRKQILRDAALKAGFGTTLLIPEPVAAAAHYASLNHGQVRPPGPIAVYDLGAGTFDCAVVGVSAQGFAVLAEDGLPDLGSLDIDQALLVHIGREVSHSDPAVWQRVLRPQSIGDRRTRRSLLQDVRDAKESLSRHQQTEIPMPEPFGDVRVTRTELEALVRPSFLRSAELLATTIHRAGLTPAQLGGVYLVGGPSRMPLLASLLANQLRIAPTTQDQPETAVAFGLHHVPAGGEDSQLTVPAFAPVSPPVQQRPVQQPPRRPQPPRWTPPPPPPGPNWRKPTAYGVIAPALAAIVTTIVLLTGGEDEPVAAPNPAVPAQKPNCDQPGQKDAQGFTDCLRRIAAVIPQRDACRDAPEAAAAMGAPSAVTCVFKSDEASNAINYYQGVAMTGLEADARRQMTKGKPVEGTWAADGLRGRYLAGVGKRSGIVLFGTDDAPLSAMLVSTRRDGAARTTQEMVDFFTAQLKP